MLAGHAARSVTGAACLQSMGFGTAHSGASTATAASLVDEARTLLTYSGQYQAIKYTSEEHLTRCVCAVQLMCSIHMTH